MATLQIENNTARKLYPSASPELKQVLIDTFGKAFFEGKITDRIASFEDCLAETGRPEVPEFNEVPEDLRDYFKATYKCLVICEALNEGKRFNLFDENARRHYPYFTNNGSPARFRLDFTLGDRSLSGAGSGSRLSLKDSKLAQFAGEKFPAEFCEMLSK